ncbi:DNA topoisomerase 2-like isoform X2 [Cornus florida]|nr:DNA topoisomerase 2-like isoform X2 [Cornus florida]
MVLVNGSRVTRARLRSKIPNYNPWDIVSNVRRLLNDEPMEPWYKGFGGTIEKLVTKKAGVIYIVSGKIDQVDDETLRITELPIGVWTRDYIKFLKSNMTGSDPFIKDYRRYGSTRTAQFEVRLSQGNMLMAKQEGLLKKFNLTNVITTSDMRLLDPKGNLKKYDTPEQILEDFYPIRLDFYAKRKESMLENLEMELLELDNKSRCTSGVAKGDVVLNRNRADLLASLPEKRFASGETKTPEEAVSAEGYGSLPMKVFSDEVFNNELVAATDNRRAKDKLKKRLDDMKNATPKSLWKEDPDELEILLLKYVPEGVKPREGPKEGSDRGSSSSMPATIK